MKDLEQSQRKQTTKYLGRLEQVEVELRGNQGRRVMSLETQREKEKTID
ncbi:hypothetical protein [Serpentinicella alkaliphila]